MNVLSAVEHAEDLHFALGDPVEDQILVEPWDWPKASAFQTNVSKLSNLPNPRHVAEARKCRLNGFDEPRGVVRIVCGDKVDVVFEISFREVLDKDP